MRIFHLITHFSLGGAERVAANIAESQTHGMEYHVVEIMRGRTAYTPKFIDELEKAGVRCHRSWMPDVSFHFLFERIAALLFPLRMLYIILRWRPDVIHTHTETPDLALYVFSRVFPRMLRRVKIVRTIHNTRLWTGLPRTAQWVEAFFKSRNANIAISDSVRDSYADRFGEVPPIINNGVAEVEQKDYFNTQAPTNLNTSTPDHITLTYGEIDTTKEKKKAEEPNIFTPHVENILLPMKTYASNVEFKQSNKSRDFINDEADDEQAEQQSYIKTGLLLHYLFSNIETADDVDSCLHDMEMEGLFDESVITPNKLKNMLHKRFSNPKVKEWFGGGWTLFNECSILSYDPHTDKLTEHRPDRVMKRGDEVQIVDFKFGKPQPEHTDQVRRYISLTHNMGYTDVKGYLWYVYSDNIVEV